MSKDFDVIVIGGGPAGYVAAIRAAQLGMKTACVDNWLNRDGTQAFGGTCLNAGCIPSKALLESSELYHRAHHEFEKHGIGTGKIKLDLAAMHERKSGICRQMNGGVQALFKSNGVEGIPGTGTVLGSGKVKVTPVDQGDARELSCEHIIIASGSSPVELKIAPFDGDRIVDSWGALEFPEVPKRLGIIGAGVIGVELGSVWQRLGAEVVLLEAMDQFLPMADQQIAKDAARQFKKQGLDIRLGARVLSAKAQKTQVKVEYQTGDESSPTPSIGSSWLWVVGRTPIHCSPRILVLRWTTRVSSKSMRPIGPTCPMFTPLAT